MKLKLDEVSGGFLGWFTPPLQKSGGFLGICPGVSTLISDVVP